jgi:hypothetical protein
MRAATATAATCQRRPSRRAADAVRSAAARSIVLCVPMRGMATIAETKVPRIEPTVEIA